MAAIESNRERNKNGDREGDPKENRESGFLASHIDPEPRSWLPWIVASVIVIAGMLTLLFFGRRSGSGSQPGGTGMAAAAPYASYLPITGVVMSEATSFSGSKVTYIDGQISNRGNETLIGVTVQVGFRNDLGQLDGRTAMPLSLIRTREPYVDTQPVSAAPLKPGEQRDFRLIFDTIPPDWNQQYPEIRVIATQAQ